MYRNFFVLEFWSRSSHSFVFTLFFSPTENRRLTLVEGFGRPNDAVQLCRCTSHHFTPTFCAASLFSLRYFSVSCAASCIHCRCFFFLLQLIYWDAVWLISQLVHSPPPFEASSILILELPVLTCQTCSSKQCQVLSYCILCMPYLPAAHTWSQAFFQISVLLLFVFTLLFGGERFYYIFPFATWLVCWETCDYIVKWYRNKKLQ